MRMMPWSVARKVDVRDGGVNSGLAIGLTTRACRPFRLSRERHLYSRLDAPGDAVVVATS